MQHPLLVHRTDYQIHHSTPQTPGGSVGNLQANTSAMSTITPSVTVAGSSTSNANISGRGNETDPQQPESAMQQLLTNISAATGSSELLGFGVGGSTSSGAQRARTPQGNSGGSSQQQTTIDDGLESPTIPSTFTRWEEESAAIDGHMPILVMRALREDILKHWIEEYEKENAPKEDQNKTTTATTSGSTSTSSGTGGEQSGTSSSTAAAAAGARGQSSQGESGSTGATVGDSTPGAITVPNPSDEATPSSHSPRDQSSVVDQLRSGLRQVADALAQTVAAVRSTRAQPTQSGEESTAGG